MCEEMVLAIWGLDQLQKQGLISEIEMNRTMKEFQKKICECSSINNLCMDDVELSNGYLERLGA